MAHNGYMTLGGREIINAERTAKYAETISPTLWLGGCDTCEGLNTVVNRPEGEYGPDDAATLSAYRTPVLDKPDWFDEDDPDSWEFAGFYPLSISGIDNSTFSAEVTESTQDGGFVSRPRRASREIRVRGLLMAGSDRSLAVGHRWLTGTLSRTTPCEGSTLSFYSACPAGLDPHDVPYGIGEFSALKASGWSATGGSLSTSTGTYTPSAAGDYISFPVPNGHGAVLTATFEQPSRTVRRRNLIPNPSFRRGTGEAVVLRRNTASNPQGMFTLAGWQAFGVSAPQNFPIEKVSDLTGLFSTPVPGITSAVRMRTTVASTQSITSTGLMLGAPTGDGEAADWVSVYAMVTGAITSFRLQVVGYSSGVVFESFFSATVSKTSTMQRLSVQTPFSPLVDNVAIVIEPMNVGPTWAPGTEIIATGVLSETDVNEASTFFDGSTPGAPEGWAYSWDGPTGRSTSRLSAPDYAGNLRQWGSGAASGLLSSQRARFEVKGAYAGEEVAAHSFGYPYPNPAVNGHFYAASAWVGNHTGDPMNIRLELGTYGNLAQSDIVTIPANGGVRVSAPSGVAYNSGSHIFMLYITTVDAVAGASFEVDDVLVEEVSGTGVATGPYFDATWESTATDIYEWDGEVDNSPSTIYAPLDPALYATVQAEAMVEGQVVASSTVSITERTVTLSTEDVLGSPVVDWRLVSTDGRPFTVTKQEWIIAEHSPALHQMRDSWTGLTGFTSSIPFDTVGRALDERAYPYQRSYRQVSRVAGPTVIRNFSSCSGALSEVEFTLVSAKPYAYSNVTSVGRASFGQNVSPEDSGFPVQAIDRCPSTFDTGPILDPACAPLPSPPTAPLLATVCGEAPGPVLRRTGLYIPPGMVRSVSEIVPIVTIASSAPLNRVNILFYPAPVQPVSHADIEPCSVCASMVVNFVPAGEMVVDGTENAAYVVDVEYSGGEPTGRTYRKMGGHLLTSLNLGPVEWPVLDCADGYLMVVETYDTVDSGYVDLKIAERE